MEIRWLASLSASGTHAAAAVLREWPIADAPLAEALAESVAALSGTFQRHHLPLKATLRHLVPLSAKIDSLRELADLVALKALGRSERHGQVADDLEQALRGLENAFRQARPDVLKELELRGRPIREQWEARGPGLLFHLARLTERELVVPRAAVILVHPICGGGGEAHLHYNSVRWEAVLANVVPELPEVLRLGWMLSMLQLDVPIHSEALRKNRLSHVAGLAMLPAALQAGEEVELCRFDEPTLLRAIDAWRVPVADGRRAADTLQRWWWTYRNRRPAMGVALAALDRMLD